MNLPLSGPSASRRILLGCLIAALTAASVAAQVVPADWHLERVDATLPLRDLQEVAVSNPFGDLRVRAGDAGELYWLAHTQRAQADPRRFEVVLEPPSGAEPAALRVHLSGSPEGTSDTAEPESWNARRADLTVFVPKAVLLHATTTDGLLEIRGVPRIGRLRTERGELRVGAGAPIEAHSQHGEVLIQLPRMPRGSTVKMSSTTSPITVEVPGSQDFAARLQSRGRFTTDFSIDIERDPRSALKVGRVQTSSTASDIASLVLESFQGSLSLLVSPVDWSDPEPLDPPADLEPQAVPQTGQGASP